MWKNAFYDSEIILTFEPTTQCNAACPQCTRFVKGDTTQIVDWIDLGQWTIDDFKSMISRKDLKRCKEIQFCGTYGDPIICRDLIPIVRYCMESNPWLKIVINTNGSARTEEWWWELGETVKRLAAKRTVKVVDESMNIGEMEFDRKPKLVVVFAIDGATQERHERYRQNTNLEVILDNMETVAAAGAKVTVQTILFDHNKNDLEEIKRMTAERGAVFWTAIESQRFNNDQPMTFKTKKGEVTLAPFVKEEEIESTEDTRFLEVEKYTQKRNNQEVNMIPVKNLPAYEITCRWGRELKRLNITYEGTVWPCCYVEWSGRRNMNGHNEDFRFTEFVDDNKSFNLKHSTLSEIMETSFYSNAEERTENTDYADSKCFLHCGKKI